MKDIIIGNKYGRWTVLKESAERKCNQIAYDCLCECGTERSVAKYQLRTGNSKSCGCLAREILGNRARKGGIWKHHLRGTFRSMKERCYNPNHQHYNSYGGRGIFVCERWHDFTNFIADNEHLYKKGLSLDRIDSDGPYSPKNCRWVSKSKQARNRRNNRYYEYNGKSKIILDWAKDFNIHPETLKSRLRKGIGFHDALTTPVKPRTEKGRKKHTS